VDPERLVTGRRKGKKESGKEEGVSEAAP